MIAAVAFATLAAVAAVPQDPAAGIDRELARARKALVRDVEYDLRFQITAGGDSVEGSSWIRFRLPDDADPSTPLVLDFAGSSLTDVRVNTKDATLRAVHDHVLVPSDLLVRDRNEITATFRAPVAPSGTPLTVYRDPADGREYLYTLVVPADAHSLYPCFDQPDLRARFRIELDLPPGWTGIANTVRVEPDKTTRPGRGDVWCFRPTKPLPTYLMAFACGPFHAIEAPPPDAPGVDPAMPMRVFLRGSQLRWLDRDTIVDLHTRGLRWLASRFGVPYPFDKLDLVLLPGFPYGGMEHAGAIFYRETALLFDHAPTAGEVVRRSTLVYHELSHQWFGNLVTMKWFDDLWLKEGFATFIAYQALEELEPEQKAWLRFLQRTKPRAYEVDGTPGTTPVFQELQNLADAKSAYGPIVYNKAPAVLRELHERLGADAFRAGLKRFLEEHSFDNADWRDLARALEGAARRDLGRWSERWLLAPSMPQVRVDWAVDENGIVDRAELTQRAIGGDGTWPLDLELLVFDLAGGQRTITVRSDAPTTRLDDLVGRAPPRAILANPHDVAYGQFVPDPRSREFLLRRLPGEPDPLVRAVGTDALVQSAREAELDPAILAGALIELLANERDPDSHEWLLDKLGECLSRWLPEERAAPLLERATGVLLSQLGREADPARQTPIFRFLARHARSPLVFDVCRAMARSPTVGKQDAFLAAAALLAANEAGDIVEEVQRRFPKEDIGKELFLARAAIPTAENKADYFRQYLQPDSPPEQWTQDSLSWFHWRGQDALTMPFLRPALEQVAWVKMNRRIFFMPAWLDAFVNGHSSPEALAIVDDFLATTELDADVRKKLLQSRDGLARAVRIRAAFAPTGR
ncbi:MAG: ERAP1-like C-terminal domain-containing protein [Planctomycetes bacterium]|nr:ERAP1-like C-terminal domain-containing protein [Planctomycetota bacterium]